MDLQVEETGRMGVNLDKSWVRFFMRLNQLKTGYRYQIILELDPRLGPSWSIVPMGKIERGLKVRSMNGSEE